MTETQYLSRPEGRIAYDVRGSGPIIIAAPGMGDIRSVYSEFADLLAASGFTVVSTDLRGHGDSDASFPSYGSQSTSTDLLALAEHLGATADHPVTLVGNSMSAGSAVIVAAERPDLVCSLVLVGPFVREPKTPVFMQWLFRALMLPPWSVAAWLAYVPTLYAGTRPPMLDEHLRALRAALGRPGAARAFRATTRTSHTAAEAAVPEAAAPTLVVMGDADPDFSDPAAEAAWIADTLGTAAQVRPRTQVALIADAGHYPQAQHPEIVADAVRSFLLRESANA